jgi:2'-5' RNA ligase
MVCFELTVNGLRRTTNDQRPLTNMRIFIALDIDDHIRQRIERFMEGVREFAPDARWVRPESLHVTLKFIGEKPPETVERIQKSLSSLSAPTLDLTFRGCGFFPTPKAARVFWIGIEAGPSLASLAKAVDEAAFVLGVPRESHPFSPHLTLARGGGGSGSPRRLRGDAASRGFQRLQEKLAVTSGLEFGTMTAREFFLYESQPMQGGSRYTKIARFALQ